MKVSAIISAFSLKSLPTHALIASTLFLGATALPSQANIFDYGVRKVGTHTQLNNAVVDSKSFSFLSQLAGNSSDFASVTTTYGGSLSPLPYNVSSFPGSTISVASTNFYNYNTQSELDAAFPNGSTYTFEISGGTLGTQTATLNSPAASLLPSIPFLSGNTWSQLQGLDPTNPFTLTWDGFSAPPASSSRIELLILPNGAPPVINQSFSPSTTSYTIPANTLSKDTNYSFTLAYTADVSPNTGFGGATGYSFFQQITDGNFSTLSTGSGSTPGDSQNNPILPTQVAPNGSFLFNNVPSGRWFDPPLASGYTYEVTSPGSLFTSILNLPTGFANPFTVTANGSNLGSFTNGQSVDFISLLGAGVSSFTLNGIFPLTDATDTQAFPLQLAFNTPTASFSQTPIIETATSVPESSNLWGLGLLAGLGGMQFIRRNRA